MMRELNDLQLKCKEPECPCYINFTGEINIPGNFICSPRSETMDNSLIINLGILPQVLDSIQEIDEPDMAALEICQQYQVQTKNSFSLDLNSMINQKQSSTDRFYLTCENNHTHSYEITITS